MALHERERALYISTGTWEPLFVLVDIPKGHSLLTTAYSAGEQGQKWMVVGYVRLCPPRQSEPACHVKNANE